MKNWSQDLPGMICPWKEDYQDAKRVAVHLDIPFKMYDFETEYRQRVVDYMVREYKAGRTPNPDIMCNQEVKFGLFLETALADGADMIATGHYARVWHSSDAHRGVDDSSAPSPYHTYGSVRASSSPSAASSDARQPKAMLLTAMNADKDQTYFLYRVTEDALERSLMPIGEFKTKAEVRALAKKYGLTTAEKKDSQGICFVGKVGIKDFLLYELGEQPHGNIVDEHGNVVGEHDGAIFYTIGQRHGLNVGGGLPYYVTGKDIAENELYVTRDLQDKNLWHHDLQLVDLHWINEPPEANKDYQVRTRYRAPLAGCTVLLEGKDAKVVLDEDVRAITPGQSAVLYDGERVVGGGIVA
jgi:tRNA-specific 2-thiouridylase